MKIKNSKNILITKIAKFKYLKNNLLNISQKLILKKMKFSIYKIIKTIKIINHKVFKNKFMH